MNDNFSSNFRPEPHTVPTLSSTSFVTVLKKNLGKFILQFVIAFGILVAVFSAFGLIPQEFSFAPNLFDRTEQQAPVATSTSQIPASGTPTVEVTGDDIIRVRIPKIGVDAPVVHPAAITIDTLDEAVSRGAVYYPGSGTPAGGNLFIFGHSTNWAVVRNPAYKTFNNLEKMTVGQEIIIETPQADFIYKVENVFTDDAENVLVDFKSDKPMLTLSTCNTLGEKQERHVVEAVLSEVVAHELSVSGAGH